MLLEDNEWMEQLANWSKSLPRPKSILMVSAHWEHRPIALGATKPVPLVYDFYGFPKRFYETQYEAPGAPELAAHVRDLLREKAIPFVDEPTRGLDHGAYVPLVAMYPEAQIPVLLISLPSLVPGNLIEFGRALAPLREAGVLIFGSGFLTHNMSYAFSEGVPSWAKEFDDWVSTAISKVDLDALGNFQAKAPAAKLALPTWEHYAPLLVAAGAAVNGKSAPSVAFPISGWWMNTPFTKRSVQFG
jgi:4,5-DOPA dioxygenase extradiol